MIKIKLDNLYNIIQLIGYCEKAYKCSYHFLQNDVQLKLGYKKVNI